MALPLCACSALEAARLASYHHLTILPSYQLTISPSHHLTLTLTREEPRPLQLPEEHAYQGTEAWRPPEACYDACGSPCDEAPGGSPWGEEGAGVEKLEEKLEVSDRSDLWSLGLVVWEMLTGEVRQPTLTL